MHVIVGAVLVLLHLRLSAHELTLAARRTRDGTCGESVQHEQCSAARAIDDATTIKAGKIGAATSRPGIPTRQLVRPGLSDPRHPLRPRAVYTRYLFLEQRDAHQLDHGLPPAARRCVRMRCVRSVEFAAVARRDLLECSTSNEAVWGQPSLFFFRKAGYIFSRILRSS